MNSPVNALYLINFYMTLDWPWHKIKPQNTTFSSAQAHAGTWHAQGAYEIWKRGQLWEDSDVHDLTVPCSCIVKITYVYKNKPLKGTMIWYYCSPKRTPIKGTWCSLLTRKNVILAVVVHLKINCLFFWKKIFFSSDKLVYDVERVRLDKLWLRSRTIKQTNRKSKLSST